MDTIRYLYPITSGAKLNTKYTIGEWERYQAYCDLQLDIYQAELDYNNVCTFDGGQKRSYHGPHSGTQSRHWKLSKKDLGLGGEGWEPYYYYTFLYKKGKLEDYGRNLPVLSQKVIPGIYVFTLSRGFSETYSFHNNEGYRLGSECKFVPVYISCKNWEGEFRNPILFFGEDTWELIQRFESVLKLKELE